MNNNETGGERRSMSTESLGDAFFETPAFEKFDRWIDASLEALVACWSPYAAPQAARPFALSQRRTSSAPSEDASPDVH